MAKGEFARAIVDHLQTLIFVLLQEERVKCPIKKGDPIDIRVRAHDNRYTVTVDQKEVKEYEHRVSLKRAI